jgi:transposase
MNCELGTIGATVYADQAVRLFFSTIRSSPRAGTRRTIEDLLLRVETFGGPERLDMQTPRRARDRLAGERTALINELRAILPEQGTVIARRRRNLERELEAMLCEENGLTVSQRLLMPIEDMREEWLAIRS